MFVFKAKRLFGANQGIANMLTMEKIERLGHKIRTERTHIEQCTITATFKNRRNDEERQVIKLSVSKGRISMENGKMSYCPGDEMWTNSEDAIGEFPSYKEAKAAAIEMAQAEISKWVEAENEGWLM